MDDLFSWAEEEVPPPTDADAPPAYDDPTGDVEPWELTPHERRIWEAGFITAHQLRDGEVGRLNHEADRLYRAAFDHRDCNCWKQRQHRF